IEAEILERAPGLERRVRFEPEDRRGLGTDKIEQGAFATLRGESFEVLGERGGLRGVERRSVCGRRARRGHVDILSARRIEPESLPLKWIRREWDATWCEGSEEGWPVELGACAVQG